MGTHSASGRRQVDCAQIGSDVTRRDRYRLSSCVRESSLSHKAGGVGTKNFNLYSPAHRVAGQKCTCESCALETRNDCAEPIGANTTLADAIAQLKSGPFAHIVLCGRAHSTAHACSSVVRGGHQRHLETGVSWIRILKCAGVTLEKGRELRISSVCMCVLEH